MVQAAPTIHQVEDFGYTLRLPPQHTFISAMADTGCLAGLNTVKKLGLSTADLLPVTLKMHAADDHDIPILGLRLSGTSSKGEAVSDRVHNQAHR